MDVSFSLVLGRSVSVFFVLTYNSNLGLSCSFYFLYSLTSLRSPMNHEFGHIDSENFPGPSHLNTSTISDGNSRNDTRSGSNTLNSTPQVHRSSAIRSDSGQSVNIQIDQVLKKFRNKAITKAKALSLVFLHLGIRSDQNEPEKEKAFELYSNIIDSISTLAAKRGTIMSGSSGVSTRDSRPNDGEQQPVNLDTSVDQQIDERVSNHSRRVNRDRGDESGGKSDEEDVWSNKRQRLKESDMPWYEREVVARQTRNPSCQKSSQLLDVIGRDIKAVKRWVYTAQTAPSGFPDSEWTNILRGKPINLDHVLSSLHHIASVKENVGRLRDPEISLGSSEPTRRIQTNGEWISAWNVASRAVSFIFPHRVDELREYGEYINRQFSVKVVSAHRKIILYDVAIRNEVAGGQCFLLTDTQRFNHLYSAIVMPDGIVSEYGKSSHSNGGKASGSRANTVCNRFNSGSGCKSSDVDCRFKHICKLCHRTGHGQNQCSNRATHGLRPKYR